MNGLSSGECSEQLTVGAIKIWYHGRIGSFSNLTPRLGMRWEWVGHECSDGEDEPHGERQRGDIIKALDRPLTPGRRLACQARYLPVFAQYERSVP